MSRQIVRLSSSSEGVSRTSLEKFHTETGGPFADAVYPAPASLGAKLLSLYIFLVVSRVLDVSPIWFLHIPLILLVVLIVTMIAGGELRTVLSSNISRWFAAFTAWVLICFPLSTWRGGSLASVESSLQAFAVFLIVAQILRTEADWRKATGAYAYAVLVASILSFFVGRTIDGRISLQNGSFADPNEFALILVVGLPFWWLKASRSGGFRKVFSFVCTVPIFVVFARTGSRSGLLALCALFLIVSVFASVGQKVLIAILAVIAVVSAVAFLPEYLKVRFTTVFAPHTTEPLNAETEKRLGGDIGSSEGREMLLIQSIQMTFEHPIYGVGPGVFAAAGWDERKKNTGIGGNAMVSHNTYTQISSETGIPGFILFVATLLLCLKYTVSDYRAARREDPEVAKGALYLFASLWTLSVGIFFLSVGYTYTLAMMFALAASLHKIVVERLAKHPVQSPASAPPEQGEKIRSHLPGPPLPRPGRFRSLRNPRRKPQEVGHLTRRPRN